MNVVGLKVFFQHPALLLPESSNSCGPPAKPGVYPREIMSSNVLKRDVTGKCEEGECRDRVSEGNKDRQVEIEKGLVRRICG